tara:strand:- start:1457 stop:2638 length:1182 start_codon:yes stop_codon:yes gene_type:complete
MIELLFGAIVFTGIFSVIVLRHMFLGKSQLVLLFLTTTLILRFIISVYNAKFGPLPGADVDAVDFVALASSDYGLVNVGTEAYLAMLGQTFRVLERSTFIASAISLLAVIPYVLFVCWILERYNAGRNNKVVFLIILLFLPSSLIFHSVSLREAYMISGLAIFAYAGCKIIDHGPYPAAVFLAIMGSLVLGYFHKGTLVIAIANILLLAFMVLRDSKVMSGLIVFAIAIGFISLTTADFGGRGLEVIVAMSDGNAVEYTKNYRQSSESLQAGTTYNINYDANIVTALLKTFVFYVFMPLPGALPGFTNLYLSFERVIAIIMIISLIRHWPDNSENKEAIKIRFFLGLFIISSVVWGLGTSNYGTALRHHSTHDFLLILAAFMAMSFNKKVYLR